MSFMTHTAAITTLTPPGGFFMDLTMVISAGFKVFKAAGNENTKSDEAEEIRYRN